ncbi:hypothetical protein Ahy_B06g080806 [Arachis hypogaea]|uniref:Protein FAR1-RELATED SEQUENCE n=1 Tax=Arachis hypogaea TaxID=3818 RepID=A0A444YJ84_ARAHY|nr:hypothetical protein Ahy_B06g080806 [Arachis hypogaea]
MATLIQDNWFVIKQEKDIGSTLKGTIGKGSIGQLLVSIARLGFVSFVTIGRRWSEIISKYGLVENEWVQGIYNDKMKWAITYLREHFFSRKRTTSQFEGIHSLLKNYVDSKTSLLEFMHKFSEFPVLTTCLKSFEKQAAEVYTRNIFKLVKDEIEAAGALNVTECPNSGDIIEYNTSEYFNQQWLFKVFYNKDKDLFVCECRRFETRRKKSDAQARLSPTSTLISDLAVVKSKGVLRKVSKGQKRRRCSHCKSRRHFIRTCLVLVNEDSPVEYSNKEDELATEEITLTQGTLKEKTNTPRIEVSEVIGATTTKKPGLPQYHYYPMVHPYQPCGGALPIPFYPV